MLVVEVFKDVSVQVAETSVVRDETVGLHFRYNLLSISLTHSLKIQLLSCENLWTTEISVCEDLLGFARRTTPSVFRRTLRMIPKDPLPMTSRGSY